MSQENSCIIWEHKAHSYFHKRLALLNFLIPTSPVPSIPFYFFKIHFNINIPYLSVFEEASLLQLFPLKKLCMHLSCHPHIPQPLPKRKETNGLEIHVEFMQPKLSAMFLTINIPFCFQNC